MSFETQGYLDAVNHPNFPSTVVTPQKPMHEVTVYEAMKSAPYSALANESAIEPAMSFRWNIRALHSHIL